MSTGHSCARICCSNASGVASARRRCAHYYQPSLFHPTRNPETRAGSDCRDSHRPSASQARNQGPGRRKSEIRARGILCICGRTGAGGRPGGRTRSFDAQPRLGWQQKSQGSLQGRSACCGARRGRLRLCRRRRRRPGDLETRGKRTDRRACPRRCFGPRGGGQDGRALSGRLAFSRPDAGPAPTPVGEEHSSDPAGHRRASVRDRHLAQSASGHGGVFRRGVQYLCRQRSSGSRSRPPAPDQMPPAVRKRRGSDPDRNG